MMPLRFVNGDDTLTVPFRTLQMTHSPQSPKHRESPSPQSPPAKEAKNATVTPADVQTDSCPVPDIKIAFTRANVPDKSDPLTIVLPILVSLDGPSRSHTTIEDLDLDTACIVGSMPTLLRNGTVSNHRVEGNSAMFDCTIRVNNDDDCIWNLLDVSATARVQGSQCTKNVNTTARYCRGQLRPEELPELPPAPVSELPPCAIQEFNVDFQEPLPSPKNPKIVRFPLMTTFKAPDNTSSVPQYIRSCSVGVKPGAIVDERTEDGVSMFDCEVEFEDETDCSRNTVVVQSTVTVHGDKNTSQCSRNTERMLKYCVEKKKPVPPAPKKCAIDQFDLSVLAVEPVNESGSFMGIEVSASYGGAGLKSSEVDEDFEFKCTVGTGEKKKKGEITNRKFVKGQVTFTCEVEITDRSKCSSNIIEIEGEMKHIGANSTCSKIAQVQTVYCVDETNPPPVPEPEEEDNCILKNLVVAVVSVDPVEEDPFGSHVDALVRISYESNEPKWEKELEFRYSCNVNGHRGITTGLTPTEDGFLFTCRFSIYDSYDSLENVIQVRASADLRWNRKLFCGHKEVVTTYHHCSKPECSFFPINLSYEGSWGLVTDDDFVDVGMLCSHPVDMCPDCFQVWPCFSVYPYLPCSNLHVYKQ